MNASSIQATAPTCLMCDAPLSAALARSGKRCCPGECEWRYALLRRQDKVCAVCGRPLAERELSARVCAAPECRRIGLADFARRVYERNQARSQALIRQEIERATRLRDRVMSAFPLREPAAFPLTVIPAFTAKPANLPERRRRNFRDHLMTLIAQVAAAPASPPIPDRAEGQTAVAEVPPIPDRAEGQTAVVEAPPAARAVMGMACACCKGACCKDGADHAYLTVDTIRRYRSAHPEQRPRDTLAAYLDRVGPRTYQGSCIFHRSDGCALSRDMRADLCNRHYCKALLEFQRTLPAEGPIRAFFVAADFGVVRAAALVNENQMLTVATE
jgi:hypothetical protein